MSLSSSREIVFGSSSLLLVTVPILLVDIMSSSSIMTLLESVSEPSPSKANSLIISSSTAGAFLSPTTVLGGRLSSAVNMDQNRNCFNNFKTPFFFLVQIAKSPP
ncbi:Hypothetical protein GLP15_5210 [Giardia lamblia P15]|uniref:Uncharacterized protein n=1 Tax=Giardia intestinalis (strain P15) TaxID=658858 RepID=E1EWD9_GIAIA|nr:Hypothetical protein GLP15_5210 [Giardia lamblia P15]